MKDAKKRRRSRKRKRKQHSIPPIRQNVADKFPKMPAIPDEKLKEYDTGVDKLEPEKAKTRVAKKRLLKKKGRFHERVERRARAEVLNTQEEGFIEPEEGVPTHFTRQADICAAVDQASATKHFELDLRFGPYRLNYTQNGRFLLLGGRKGHVAAFDWMTKELMGEMNVMETVRDVQWLHVENMYAVAQKRWLRIYDRAGTELHCIKGMFDIQRLEFLPRHFLLVGSGANTFLTWLDVSIGKEVASFPTGHGCLDVLAQNPSNAIILSGDSRGTVCMWSPNEPRKPLVEMFAHRGPVQGLAVDPSGRWMATTGLDNRLRVWDVRMYREMYSYAGQQRSSLGQLAWSQRNCLAVAANDTVQIYKDPHLGHAERPYLLHQCSGLISDLQFCPYEDVLGVAHTNGLVSLLVPGSGQANFDALHANPFESKRQRQEREVRMLLDKLQPELITLDPADINRVNRKGLRATMDYKRDVMHIRPDEIEDAGEGD